MTFSFKDVSSETMGVKIITMSGAQRAPCEPEIVSVPGRYEPLILEKHERQTTEITAELLVENPDNVRQIFSWLSGKGKLIFSDEPDKYYNVISNDIISLQRIDDRIQSFEMKFVCEPFAYSVSNPSVNIPMFMNDNTLTGSMEITYNGTCEGEPLLYFAFAGKLRVTVNDSAEPLILTTSEGEYTDTMLEAGTRGDEDSIYAYNYKTEYIYVDSAARIAYTPAKSVVVNQTSGRLPVFKQGVNTISFQLVKEEWEYNSRIYRSHNQKLEMFGYQKNERWY